MKKKILFISFILIFIAGCIVAFASPVHEISKEYENSGSSFQVNVSFFDRTNSNQAFAIVNATVDTEVGKLPVKVVTEKELKLATKAYNDIKNDKDFKDWAKNADYYAFILVINPTTKKGEVYYISSQKVGSKDAINSKSWLIN